MNLTIKNFIALLVKNLDLRFLALINNNYLKMILTSSQSKVSTHLTNKAKVIGDF